MRPEAFERESHCPAAVTFGAVEMRDQPSDDGNTSYPKRRILPSLVPEQQLGDPLPDAQSSAPVSRARKPTSVRAIKGQDYASKLSRSLETSPELTAQLADRSPVGSVRSSVPPNDGIAVSAGEPTATANRVAGNSSGPAPRPKAKQRVQIPTALDASSVPITAPDQRSITRTESSGAPTAAVDEASRPNRKRTIMGRYVFRDELKPGERWKRRLSTGR